VDRIKRLSYEVLDKHKSKFNENFTDNKKQLDNIAIIRSKGLKNEIAGYITKFIKKEVREEKEKQARLLATELQSTRRRVNVLEHVVIPELQETIKYIYTKLGEAERDNTSRLMKIADIIRG